MNANLLAMLGGAGAPPSSTRRENEGKTILSFKAGKMTPTLQENGKYMVSPDARRGTVDVTWQSTSSGSNNTNGMLKFTWTDRRTRTKVDSLTIFPEDNVSYTKIDTGRSKDRVYLLQYGSDMSRLYFYWMQDKEEGNEDEENCVKVNMYCADPNEARVAANGSGADSSTGGEGGEESSDGTSSGGTGSGDGSTSSADGDAGADGSASNRQSGGALDLSGIAAAAGSSQQGQVDALSNILENLGMPPQPSTTTTNAPANDVTATPAPTASNASTDPATPAAPARNNNNSAAGGGGLTLSDLQGAMATLATTSPPAAATPGPPLSQVATPDAVISSGILDDASVKSRLIELLPEGQRTEEHLMENLRSPQVRQCLNSLTEALCDDNVNSILANFQLRPEDGAEAMASGNPIQAFLDCVLKSVEREKENDGEDGKKQDDGDAEMSG